ncbi:MAG: prenyltransferase/squalene oxidase repeat-containing protein [Pirellulaceae bacterium]
MHCYRNIVLLVVFAGTVVVAARPAQAVTPESKEVKAAIERALKSFETAQPDTRMGADCLIALCYLKNGREIAHPRIQKALARCTAFADKPGSEDVYSVGLSLILLCELDPAVYNLDPEQHRVTIDKILAGLLKMQKKHGGWGYYTMETGDTSQTQYAALGIWMAQAAGAQVPQENVERLCGWLLRTQDPEGYWGYQGNDSGGQGRVKQTETRHSLVAAGLGSLYICADLLDITDPKDPKPDNGQPAALRVVETKGAKKKGNSGIAKTIDGDQVRGAMTDGNNWFERNFAVESSTWTHYYLYGFERYRAYRELAEGRFEKNPQWYNDVFAYLQRTQRADGSWDGQDTPFTATCFSILCLSHSSRKTIQRIKALGEGVLIGGMGLPANTADLQVRNGKVVESPLAGSVDELLAIIEDPNHPELSRMAEAGEVLPLDSDVTRRSGQIIRLRALVSAGTYESRLVAVKTLGTVRDLDNVPILLYALTDPDIRIVREADQALRFISRKFAGVGLPAEPNVIELQAAREAWKQWLLDVRPDAELLE